MKPLPVASASDRVRIRTPRWSALLVACAPALGAGIALLFLGSDVRHPWVQLAGYALGGLAVGLYSLTCGAILTPTELIIRGRGRRRIPWSAIVLMSERTILGTRHVKVWTGDGRGHRLYAPTSTLGIGRQRFDAEAAFLQQWWRSHAVVA